MKYAWLIAVREYVENVKTKGFWIGMLLFPTILFLSIQAPILLEKKATPTRYFVLVDQSGQFDKVIADALERYHQRQLLRALTDYASKYVQRAGTNRTSKVDLESTPAPSGQIDEFLESFADTNPQALDQFSQQGGKEAFLKQVKPHVRKDSPDFHDVRQRFVRVPLPGDIKSTDSITNIARALRGYLRGDSKLMVDDTSSEATCCTSCRRNGGLNTGAAIWLISP